MAKYDLKFLDATGDNSYIKCEVIVDPDSGEEFVCIDSFNHEQAVIWLDKSTAIKFAKTLRTEINKIQD
jgi:hypothetical protein